MDAVLLLLQDEINILCTSILNEKFIEKLNHCYTCNNHYDQKEYIYHQKCGTNVQSKNKYICVYQHSLIFFVRVSGNLYSGLRNSSLRMALVHMCLILQELSQNITREILVKNC